MTFRLLHISLAFFFSPFTRPVAHRKHTFASFLYRLLCHIFFIFFRSRCVDKSCSVFGSLQSFIPLFCCSNPFLAASTHICTTHHSLSITVNIKEKWKVFFFFFSIGSISSCTPLTITIFQQQLEATKHISPNRCHQSVHTKSFFCHRHRFTRHCPIASHLYPLSTVNTFFSFSKIHHTHTVLFTASIAKPYQHHTFLHTAYTRLT